MGNKLTDRHSIVRSAQGEAILLAIGGQLYDGVLDYGETNVPYQHPVSRSVHRSSPSADRCAVGATDGKWHELSHHCATAD
jgi:hypothetical protein